MNYTWDGPRTSVTVTRRFNASPDRVFDAWVNPAVAEKWLFTTKSSQTTYELDVRPGGAYTITRVTDGNTYTAVGTYLEIDRPRRLVFTFSMPQFAADIATVTIEIVPDGDGCILTLTQDGMRPGFEEATIHGWGQMFTALEEALSFG